MDNELKKQYVKEFLSITLDRAKPSKELKNLRNKYYKDLPKTLFRYRQANEYSLKNLDEMKFSLSHPNFFNDPYDSLLSINVEAAIKINPSIEDVDIKKNVIKNEITLFRDMMYIACFSEICDSILMWSHYSSFHQGFCIEYSTKSFDNIFRSKIMPVIYQDTFMNIVDPHIGINKLKLPESLYYKALCWEYEKEWRYVVTTDDHMKEYILINEPEPVSLYLGCKMEEDYKSKVIEICQKRKIPYKQLRMCDTEFKLIVEGL